jgi:hypothetical protein
LSDTRSQMNQPAQILPLGTSFICWELLHVIFCDS